VVRRVEFMSDRMSYIILRGHWCNIIVLNVHTQCEDKEADVEDSFYEALGRVFDQVPRYDMKILLGDFNVKVGRENIFKPTMETRVYMKLVMTLVLEQSTLPHLKI
jgi:hypothetical protein